MVSDSVSKKISIKKSIGIGIGKKFGIEKSIRFGIGKILYRKKYRIRYRLYLVLKKNFGFVMEKNYQKNLGFVGLNHGFLKFGIGIGIGFETFPVFWLVSDSVSKKFGIAKVSDSVSEKIGIEKSIGIGIQNIWYQKKDSDSFSFRFWVSSHTAPIATRLCK